MVNQADEEIVGYLLGSILSLFQRKTVDKLNSTPQPMELRTFINMHDAIDRVSPLPRRIVEERFYAI